MLCPLEIFVAAGIRVTGRRGYFRVLRCSETSSRLTSSGLKLKVGNKHICTHTLHYRIQIYIYIRYVYLRNFSKDIDISMCSLVEYLGLGVLGVG